MFEIGKTFGRNELTWGFDDLGRTTSVRGDIREIFSRSRSSRESSTTAIVGNSPDAGPHSVGGHIAAHRFTGEDTGLFNIVPQNGRRDPLSAADLKNLNQGAYAQFENEVSDWVTRGERLGKPVRVEFEVKLAYTGASKEPDRFSIIYKVIGDDGTVLFKPDPQDLLNQSGQIFNRTTLQDMDKILNRN